MNQLEAAGVLVDQAGDLPAVLDAACDAFEQILGAIRGYEDSHGMNLIFLLAATQAANGRDAVLFAPSLPPQRVHPAPAPPTGAHPVGSENITACLVALSQVLAMQLAGTAIRLPDSADRMACQKAAHYARQIHDLLTGGER